MMLARTAALTVMAATLAAGIGCGSGDAKSTTTSATVPSGQAMTAKKKHRSANWPTYHSNLARTGVDTTSPALDQVRRTWTRQVDAPVYGEPLALGSRVYVATE